MIEFLFIMGTIAVLFAIIQDFKTREVANWLNFSLIVFALAARMFWSVFADDYSFILFGLFGLGVGFLVAHIFYYSRLFAGGDAKLLIALFTVIPIENTFYYNVLIFLVFLIALLVFGALYSLLYSISLSILNWKEFKRSFGKKYRRYQHHFYLSFFVALFFLVLSFFPGNTALLVVSLVVFVFPYLYIYLKSVEQASLVLDVPVSKLTIGDWLVEKVRVHGREIKPDWEGLSEKDLGLLKKYYREKVRVRYGVPFTPSFLFALFSIIALYYFGADWGLWGIFS
tara:strand:+ start:523 stop:1374 length:852 start_codon:yes stop_codon:yes gene_type:complete